MTVMTSLLLGVLVAIGQPYASGEQGKSNDLPALHVIKHVSLGPAYSCRQASEVALGYQNTALFVSAFSRQRNSPDLLFNGACGSEDYFHSSTAGDDMALIADLGPGVSLANVTAARAFNLSRISGTANESHFMDSVPVALGHTYVILLNKRDVRGLIVFTVTDFDADKRVELDYVVKGYDIQAPVSRADGWDWDRESSRQ